MIDERNARIVGLTEALAGVQVQLELAGNGLRASRQALGATEQLLRDAAEEARTARESVFGQQQRVEILRTCLAGTVQAMNYLAAGDQHGAVRVMVAVGPGVQAGRDAPGAPLSMPESRLRIT